MCLIKSFKISFAFFFTFCYSLLWSLLSFLEDGVFTFTLKAYEDDAHTTPVPDPVALDVEITLKLKSRLKAPHPALTCTLCDAIHQKTVIHPLVMVNLL